MVQADPVAHRSAALHHSQFQQGVPCDTAVLLKHTHTRTHVHTPVRALRLAAKAGLAWGLMMLGHASALNNSRVTPAKFY